MANFLSIEYSGNLTNIFISYRREDSAAYAGRICDHLTELLGPKRVFMDVEAITPGQNFAQAIDQTVGSCQTVLVIIGPRWLQILLERAQDAHEDYVRHEIEGALVRKANIIPVLVGGARASEISGLPDGLQDLHFHQAVELRDSSFRDDCDRLARALGASPISRWRNYLLMAAAFLIAVALFFEISKRTAVNGPVQQLLATAQTQSKLNEYEAAYQTCTQALKLEPTNKAILNQQVDAAMRWLENYSVLVGENQDASSIAGPQLAELMQVLDTGLASTPGNTSRSADILAHIGWAHWLNQHIAEKEFGTAAEQSLRQALATDPHNVFANAMLGNWLLQTNGSFAEANQHFATALATNRERPLVRRYQLAGLQWEGSADESAAAFKALNEMRRNAEPVEERTKHRFLSTLFDLNYSDEFMSGVLTAIPPADIMPTYLWLDDAPTSSSDSPARPLIRDLIQGRALQLQGKNTEAIAAFQALQLKLKTSEVTGKLSEHVTSALVTLIKN